MKSFTDTTGRVWTITVNVGAIKRVRALCGVDLNAIVEVDEKNNVTTGLLERLSTDPVLLVDVLYAICKPECDAKGVSDEEFGCAMAGDAIEHATDALLDEVVDFFPEAKRLALKKVLTATRRFAEAAKQKLMATLNNGELDRQIESELERLNDSSGNARESAE